MIIVLIVIVAAVIVVAAVLARRRPGGRDLKQRFGPEYERAVDRHDGDSQAAERELDELVSRHGSLREQEIEPAKRQMYEARWAAAQEHFVDSPRDAVGEVDRLLGEVAGARGFPDGGQYDEQLAALSVHHADHVHGYRRVHVAARAGGEGRTEEMREAIVEARPLFEELVGRSAGSGHKTNGHKTNGHKTGWHKASWHRSNADKANGRTAKGVEVDGRS